MRVELKYKSNYVELRRIILNLKMLKKHLNRTVNSIYFDNHNKSNYVDSMEGTVPRKKIRFRWYGLKKIGSYPTGQIEIKRTFPNFRDKKIFKLKKFNLDEVNKQINQTMFPNVNPVCQVTYLREYFENSKGYRMTVDSNIKYYKISNVCGVQNCYFENSCIAELKVNNNEDYEEISSNFDHLRVRNSKYCNSIEKLYETYIN